MEGPRGQEQSQAGRGLQPSPGGKAGPSLKVRNLCFVCRAVGTRGRFKHRDHVEEQRKLMHSRLCHLCSEVAAGGWGKVREKDICVEEHGDRMENTVIMAGNVQHVWLS